MRTGRVGEAVSHQLRVWFVLAELADDRELSLRLVQHITQVGQAADALLPQLGKHVVVSETAQTHLVPAELAVVDEDAHAVTGRLCDPRSIERANVTTVCATSNVISATAPTRNDCPGGDRRPAEDRPVATAAAKSMAVHCGSVRR
jgi:hypothetical protein